MSGSRAGRVDDREVPPDTPVRFGLREPSERRAGGNVPASLALTTPAADSAAADATAIASGRRVILAEAGGLGTLAQAIDGSFAAVVALLAEVSGRVVVTGMGKSGHVALQDRGDPGVDRHARPLRPSRRGQPRRSRHDHRAGCGARPVQLGRDQRAARPHPLHAPVLDPADRLGRARAQHAGGGRRPHPSPAGGRRGLPDGPGPHDLHHLHAGAGRRPGGGAARTARLLGPRFRRVPPGRQAGQPAPARANS